jgi:hypothetical protein
LQLLDLFDELGNRCLVAGAFCAQMEDETNRNATRSLSEYSTVNH